MPKTPADPQPVQADRAAWLHAARWGLCVHYLPDHAGQTSSASITPVAWSRRVDAFDARRFIKTVRDVGASYVIFTIGQNSGFYCSPNETYDELLGRPTDESRLSKRDLIADLAEEARAEGIRLIAYLPSHAPANDPLAIRRLRCTPPWDMSRVGVEPSKYAVHDPEDATLSAFQENWQAIVREWSRRWGTGVAGWWIDGCVFPDQMYRQDAAPNFFSFADALRAGNPESIVAFNGGTHIPPRSMTPAEDYTAGETNHLVVEELGWRPDRFVNGKQLHLLTYLGKAWGSGPLRFTPELARAWMRHVFGLNGVVTWDVPLAPDGSIPSDFVRVLRVVGRD